MECSINIFINKYLYKINAYCLVKLQKNKDMKFFGKETFQNKSLCQLQTRGKSNGMVSKRKTEEEHLKHALNKDSYRDYLVGK